MQTITLPDTLEGLANATVRRWCVEVGQAISRETLLVELDTPRSMVCVHAGVDGVLAEILAPVGTTVCLGGSLGKIAPTGQPIPVAAPNPKPQPVKVQPKETPMAEPTGQVTPILMPQVGNSMEEGTIISWHVNPGDTIEVGQVIFEVETDKAAVEIEATDPGRLARIVVDAGETIEVLKPIAYIAENDADVDTYIARQGGGDASVEKKAEPSTPAATLAQTAAPVTSSPSTTDTGRVKASPAARKVAEQRGVDIASVGAGSGPGGRILSSDVPSAAAAPAPVAQPVVVSGGATRQPMTSMRKAIGKALQMSKQTVPHFYLEMTVDADAMMNFYRLEKAKYKCSVNDVVVLAVGRTLAEFSAMRSRIDGDDIVTLPNANIGVAVGGDDGLLVPVVQGVEAMTLQQLAVETRRVVESARSGKIEGMGKGVFTISNLGMFGVDRFNAIINPPEAGILAVGAVREEVIVSGGTMRPGRVMSLTLSCDHRVVDGLVAAKFLARLKQLLENPGLLV